MHEQMKKKKKSERVTRLCLIPRHFYWSFCSLYTEESMRRGDKIYHKQAITVDRITTYFHFFQYAGTPHSSLSFRFQ